MSNDAAPHRESRFFEGYEPFAVDVGEVTLRGVRTPSGDAKPPLLLLHGHPETHLIWHKVAADLARDFDVVAPDLRGYGASDAPRGGGDHAAYSKRAMADDLLTLMREFGHERFAVAAHDRGARVTARLVLDHPESVSAAILMDIAPTLTMYERTDRTFAQEYFHWFLLPRPEPLPERLVGGDPRAYVEGVLGGRHAGLQPFPPAVIDAYVAALDAAHVHGMCEDYRAAATIDLDHDRADRDAGHRTSVPLRVLWGAHGLVGRLYEPVELWREWADTVSGRALDCGHYLPEEAPAEVLAEIRAHLS